jgi:predicted ester cyclase
VAPTGKPVRFQNVSIARLSDGRVVQYNSETGWLDFLT